MNKPVKISVNADNITEILGYYHHELSQHTNDLNTLKEHVHNLLTKTASLPNSETDLNNYSNSISYKDIENSWKKKEKDFQIFLDTSNTRFEAFAASIKSLSEQLVLFESCYKKDIENTANKITAYIDESFLKINEKIDKIDKIASGKDNFTVKSPVAKSKSSLKKNSKKKKQISSSLFQTANSKTDKHNGSNNSIIVQRENVLKNEIEIEIDKTNENENENKKSNENTKNENDQNQILFEITNLKNSLKDCRNNSTNEKEELKDLLVRNNKEMIDEFNNVYIKIDECITKNELDSILFERKQQQQCFSPFQTPMLQTPRKTVHVTMINGDSLSRRQSGGVQNSSNTKSTSFSAKGKPRYYRQTQ